MKHNDENSIPNIRRTNLANLFNIYEDTNIGNFTYVYAINRTLNFIGIENINKKYFERYVVKTNDTWISIANEFYQDGRLWWLICKINNIANPMIDPEDGAEIYILTNTDNILDTIRVR